MIGGVLRVLSCTICPAAEFSALLADMVPPCLLGTRPDTNTLSSYQEIRQMPVSTCRGGTALCRNAAKNEGRGQVLSGVHRTQCQEKSGSD